MKKTQEKGITLIALVITIIILLILAGISINAIFGENGLIKRANDTKVEQRAASVDDEVNMWKANNKASEYTKTGYESPADFIAELIRKKVINENETDGTNTITIGDRTWVLEGESNQYAGIEIGSYVDYQPTSRKLSN